FFACASNSFSCPFVLLIRPPLRSTLFPYTTLFRSLMDEVGSRLNLKNSDKDSDSIEHRLQEIVKEKEQAAEKEDYERAAHLRYQEIQLQKQLDKSEDKEKVLEVDVSDI